MSSLAGTLIAQCVIELRQVLGLELDVEDRTDHLHHPAFRLIGHCEWSLNQWLVLQRVVLRTYPLSAAAPPTISAISCVI